MQVNESQITRLSISSFDYSKKKFRFSLSLVIRIHCQLFVNITVQVKQVLNKKVEIKSHKLKFEKFIKLD